MVEVRTFASSDQHVLHVQRLSRRVVTTALFSIACETLQRLDVRRRMRERACYDATTNDDGRSMLDGDERAKPDFLMIGTATRTLKLIS